MKFARDWFGSSWSNKRSNFDAQRKLDEELEGTIASIRRIDMEPFAPAEAPEEDIIKRNDAVVSKIIEKSRSKIEALGAQAKELRRYACDLDEEIAQLLRVVDGFEIARRMFEKPYTIDHKADGGPAVVFLPSPVKDVEIVVENASGNRAGEAEPRGTPEAPETSVNPEEATEAISGLEEKKARFPSRSRRGRL
jgi:hypothetical protein